ncbi:hypothetical protein AB0E77_33690 [Streptomyces sp. NPDC032940]|uniref:hypothetical protein n=1 Tax=Streptomyces sp. NPDC032940 TaxID=3155366 RepID=UPI0033CE4F7F
MGWRDTADAIDAAGPLACGAMPQEGAESHGMAYGQISSVGNEDQGDGAHFQLAVLGPQGGSEPASKAEATELVKENLAHDQELYDCFDPKPSGMGDDGLTFSSERFTHIVMGVGPVEVFVHTPLGGDGPTAHEWARVLERRIRAVLERRAPTARGPSTRVCPVGRSLQ